MEVVRAFNNELSALYENKPPISKARMTQVTKAAIKGIKFYKHVVQSVEKFIQKCRPEYKVPGLYVVDSIVRQSRHQFGAEKDVFAPRFTKNIALTFQNLFKCPEEERPKIVRVLNLWQKNNVFPSEVIQPLLDMANPNAPSFQQPTSVESSANLHAKHKSSDISWKGWQSVQIKEEMESRTFPEPTSGNIERFSEVDNNSQPTDEVTLLSHMQQMNTQLLVSNMEMKDENVVQFNKKLLDFDYGDEEEEEEDKQNDGQDATEPNALALSMAQNLLSNPELLRQLQQMQQTIQQTEGIREELSLNDIAQPEIPQEYPPQIIEQSPPIIPFPEPLLHSHIPIPFDGSSIPFPPPPQQPPPTLLEAVSLPLEQPPFQIPVIEEPKSLALIPLASREDEDERMAYIGMPDGPPLPPHDLDERPQIVAVVNRTDDTDRRERSRSRSGSRSRTRSRHHRSRSRSPRRRRSRSRSGSRSRSRRRDGSKSREERERERYRERERERDRKRKGLPLPKRGCVTVCSTTLWLGHVPKTVSEEDISDVFGDFGIITSIDMILPRGCAYVCMDKRYDAARAIQKLKNLKLQGSPIKIAWAPGRGVKGKEYKEYWVSEQGCSFIPSEKVPENLDDLELVEEGGVFDEDTLIEKIREQRRVKEKEKQEALAAEAKAAKEAEMQNEKMSKLSESVTTLPSSMPTVTSSMNIPMVLPPLVQHPFGMTLPGLMHSQPMVMSVPVGVPPPATMMMVQPPSQTVLGGQPLPMMNTVPQMPPATLNVSSIPSTTVTGIQTMNSESAASPIVQHPSAALAGDATPTEEEGTSLTVPSSSGAPPTVPSVGSATILQATANSVQPTAAIPPASQVAQLIGIQPRPNMSMLSIPPPVSGAPPFPPPVGFGFPPPIRPLLNQTGVPSIAPPATTPSLWPPKNAMNSPFIGYSDSDMRYNSTSTVSTSGILPSPKFGGHQDSLQQGLYGASHVRDSRQSSQHSNPQSTHPNDSLLHTPNRLSVQGNPSTSEGSQAIPNGTGQQTSQFNGPTDASNLSPVKASHSSLIGSPRPPLLDHSRNSEKMSDESGELMDTSEIFGHDRHDVISLPLHDDSFMTPPPPRFQGPPGLHMGKGLLDPRMRGPAPGRMMGPMHSPNRMPFPPGRPGTPYPHRLGGPRGFRPRREMDFPMHGPRPRIPMGGAPRRPPRWSPLPRPQFPLGPDRGGHFGRRPYYDRHEFEREEFEEGFSREWDRDKREGRFDRWSEDGRSREDFGRNVDNFDRYGRRDKRDSDNWQDRRNSDRNRSDHNRERISRFDYPDRDNEEHEQWDNENEERDRKSSRGHSDEKESKENEQNKQTEDKPKKTSSSEKLGNGEEPCSKEDTSVTTIASPVKEQEQIQTSGEQPTES